MLAAPVSVTEEVWNLSAELSLGRIALIAVTSLLVIGVFVYTSFKNDGVIPNGRDFYIRVNTIYFVTLMTCALMLVGIDRLELFTAPLLLAKTLRWLPPPASKNDSTLGPWIVGLVCLTAVGLAFTFWRISASDRSSQTRNFHRYNEPRPEVFDALKSLEICDESDMFRSLREDDGQSPPTNPADA